MKNMPASHLTHTPIAKFSSQSKDWRSQTALLLSVTLIISFVAPAAAHGTPPKKAKSSAAAPKNKITITYPESNVTASGGFIDLEYKADGDEVEAFKVKVTTETDGYSGPVSPKSVRLFLFKGKNTIKLTGYKDGKVVPGASAEIVATCNRGCIDDVSPLGGPIHPFDHADVETQDEKPAKQSNTAVTGPRNISIRVLGDAASTIEPTIVVQEKSAIKSLYVDVYNGAERIDAKNALKVEYMDGIAILPVKLKLAAGTNRISVFDVEHLGDSAFTAVASVHCAADKCKGETGGAATTKNIKILAPTEGDVQKAKLDFYVSIAKGSKTEKLVSVVFQDGKTAVISVPFEVPNSDNNDVEINRSLKVPEGESTVSFMDPKHVGEAAFIDKVKIKCVDKCAATAAVADEEAAITIIQPDPDKPETVDTPVIDTYLSIAKGTKIEKLKYQIFNGEEVVYTSPSIDVKKDPDDKRQKRVEVKILSGTNTVTFFDAADPGNVKHKASFKIECNGDHCPLNFDIAKYPSNSLNTRVVVGMEQAGASSAESTSKPFIDFFFTTPFLFKKYNCGTKPESEGASKEEQEKYRRKLETYNTCRENRDREVRVARAGFWAQVRIATSPAQIANAEVLPSSLVNQVSNPANVIELVQSFDFLAGAEARIKTSNGNFLSLIPGLRQRTSLYFAGGSGAISPLQSTKQAVQIFKVPVAGDPQRPEFVRRYGIPPAGANNVAFLPLDRDRFFRQWYAGIRLKTHYCENYSCSQLINSFPAIVDFMFGQNESVTGGSLFYYKQTDPNDPSKLEKKRAYVLRLDAFYPFPIKEAKFLYFYGSAMLKVGGGGVSVQNPLFLDRVDSAQLSDTDLYIPSVDIQKQRVPNRDYYKIGVGINLTELFNRNKGTRQ